MSDETTTGSQFAHGPADFATMHSPTPSPDQPPPYVRAQCEAAARVIEGLEERDLRLRMDVDERTGTVHVTLVDTAGRAAGKLAGRRVLELLCGR